MVMNSSGRSVVIGKSPCPTPHWIGNQSAPLLTAMQSRCYDWRRLASEFQCDKNDLFMWWSGKQSLDAEIAVRILRHFGLVRNTATVDTIGHLEPVGSNSKLGRPKGSRTKRRKVDGKVVKEVLISMDECKQIRANMSRLGMKDCGLAGKLKCRPLKLRQWLAGTRLIPVDVREKLMVEVCLTKLVDSAADSAVGDVANIMDGSGS